MATGKKKSPAQAKKPVTKKTPAKKTTVKKIVAKKPAAKKTTVKKAVVKKAAPKKATAKKTAPKSKKKTQKKNIENMSEQMCQMIEQSLDADKAEGLITIPLAGKSSIADYMIIASGRSGRQVSAMAQHIVEKLRALTGSKARVEGVPNCDWVVIDGGDVIVHLFRPEVRSFYNLEKMWGIDTAQEPLIVR